VPQGFCHRINPQFVPVGAYQLWEVGQICPRRVLGASWR
jgi:hypothetical protein